MSMIKGWKKDSFDEFSYDPKSKRYRVSKGVAKGKYVTKESFLYQTEKYLDSQKSSLVSLGEKLYSNKIDLKQFQIEATKHLKEIHVSNAILSANGIENLAANDFLLVGRNLKSQYYAGIDKENDRRFGIKYLVKDILEGNVSEAQLKQRLGLYAESGKKTYWEIQGVKSNGEFAKRILGVAEHCPSCISYAARGVVKKSEVVYPTQACQCGMRCKCTISFLSLEEAIREGYRNAN